MMHPGGGIGAVAGYGVILVLLAAGCGGGGGGGSRATATPTTVRDTPTAPVATATMTPTIPASPTPDADPTATPTQDFEPVATATPTQVVAEDTHTPAPSPTVPEHTPPSETPATPTTPPPPTPTPIPVGPVVSAFGLADTSGTFDQPAGQDPQGRAVFARQVGAGFVLYVEGRPGSSGLPVALNVLSFVPGSAAGRPDLQILTSRDLGDGSSAVCDVAHPNPGGVPAVEPPDFATDVVTSDALNDLSCRFRVFEEPGFACTQDAGNNFRFVSLASTIQFCTLVNDAFAFPVGDTILTVRLRDTAGNVGEPRQIVVRIRG